MSDTITCHCGRLALPHTGHRQLCRLHTCTRTFHDGARCELAGLAHVGAERLCAAHALDLQARLQLEVSR